ncbi:hypothetical protein MMC19_006941 [Ptychographa xylographoides]|nr:hypothetical protein [Ptychographa xylographoides]
MSTVGAADLTPALPSPATKNKKHRKKKLNGQEKPNGTVEKFNGLKNDPEDIAEEEEPATPIHESYVGQHVQELSQNGIVPSEPNGISPASIISTLDKHMNGKKDGLPTSPREIRRNSTMTDTTPHKVAPIHDYNDTEARLDALARERATLREEVAGLRKSLEEIQEKHEAELGSMRDQIENTQGQKDHAETRYRDLLGKVNTIKSQLGERLKADAEDLSQARSRIEDLEEQNNNLQQQNALRGNELSKLAEEGEQRSKELSSLRNRLNLSQQNWSKEREDLLGKEKFTREEFENAKQAMQDWEVLAMEERSHRENLAERVADMEDQVSNHKEAHEKAARERDSQSVTVDGLQRALQEIQEARKRELRELVENSQTQIEELRKQLQEVQAKSKESSAALEIAQAELERALPFETEVKEKNLLIGKLRHEAVILNEHITKALKQLKRGRPDENIDKQLISNHFLHFLALERTDPRKFQILQIISALLSWSDEQREQAGLARPGTSNPSLRTPISPWHRTPSTPALSADGFQESRGRKESLAGLFSDFLEQGADEGARSSRSTSISSAVKHS